MSIIIFIKYRVCPVYTYDTLHHLLYVLKKPKQKKNGVMVEVGSRIRLWRKNANLTQEELAEKVDLNDRTLGEIERGEINFRLLTLLRICKALKKSPNNLLQNLF